AKDVLRCVTWPEWSLEAWMSFGIYMIGFLILMIGLGTGAHLMHVPAQWIGVGALCLAGLGILLGVTSTKQRDKS
ncbi:MAG: hypothetical protein ABUS51_05575, partial [Acidobacteriota bacterium]